MKPDNLAEWLDASAGGIKAAAFILVAFGLTMLVIS